MRRREGKRLKEEVKREKSAERTAREGRTRRGGPSVRRELVRPYFLVGNKRWPPDALSEEEH